MKSFNGVVLAGGASRRMGQDKALIQCGKITMLQHMQQLLVSAGAAAVVVLGRADMEGGVLDKSPFSGPAKALADYLSTQPINSRHLVVPVDMPGLQSKWLQLLAGKDQWAHFEDHMLPLFAIAGPKQEAPRRIRDLLEINNAAQLPISMFDHQSLSNLNTPADIDRWRGHYPFEEVLQHV